MEDFVREKLLLKEIRSSGEQKLFNLSQTVEFVKCAHELGKTVVVTEGTWDLTHAGHVQNIRESGKHADLVVMRLASSEYAKTFKGPDRPIESYREIVVSEFEGVDAVVVDETAIDPTDIQANAAVLAQIDPDFIAIETEDEKFQLKLDTAKYAHDNLGSRIQAVVFTLPLLNSTTMIINRILEMKQK